MKRAIAILLTFLLVLSSAGALASESYYIGTMRVVNCEEWVSLRVEPSISSDYVDTVPLGAVVYAYYYNEEFTRCYYYGWGYIKNEYLTIEEAYNPIGLGSVERAFGESGFWELYPDYEAFDLPYANTTHTGGWIEAQYLFSTGSRQYTVVNCESFVSLRQEADDSTDRILKVPLGATVYVNGLWHGWALSEYQGRYGWIKTQYLELSDPYYTDSNEGDYNSSYEDEGDSCDDPGYYLGGMYVVNCEEWISLREYASTSSARLDQIPLGTFLEAYQVDDRFARVNYNGMTGYVLLEYLSYDPPMATQHPSTSSGSSNSSSTQQYGAWSDWQDAPVSPSNTRQVETRTVYGYYYFACPNCGNHVHVWDYGDPTWCGGCGYSGSIQSGWVSVFTANAYDYNNPAASLNDWQGTGRYYYDDPSYGRLFAWIDSGNPAPNGKTQYRYRDIA